MSKKKMAGIVAILLGLGILWGDKAKLNHYMDKAVYYVSQYIGETKEKSNLE